MTFHNNKLHCCGAETAEYGYDDIHSCCHHYGYGNFAPQLCTLAGTMDALHNTFISGVGGWGGGSLERKHKGCWWWQRLLVWHPCWGDLSAEEWICTRRKTVRGVIKGCRYNQPQSSALAPHTVWACNSPFITHLPLCLQRHGYPGRNSKPQRSHSIRPELFGCNQAVAVLPWKPWRNLEPSGSSSGVYSLYPPTKSWLKTLRPTRGPGDEPVLLRCPSTFRKM